MAQSSSLFTGFDTDSTDIARGLDQFVFGNFSDFGKTFQFGRRALPNPYGPIVLKFSPSCLIDATDIAVCDRSAGAADFDRISEAMTMQQIQELLVES